MASRRKCKKQIKLQTDVLIEDAFVESINGDAKEADKMDKIIDEIIDDRMEMLGRVCNYPQNGQRAAIKEHFKSIKADLTTKAQTYHKQIGRVG